MWKIKIQGQSALFVLTKKIQERINVRIPELLTIVKNAKNVFAKIVSKLSIQLVCSNCKCDFHGRLKNCLEILFLGYKNRLCYLSIHFYIVLRFNLQFCWQHGGHSFYFFPIVMIFCDLKGSIYHIKIIYSVIKLSGR